MTRLAAALIAVGALIAVAARAQTPAPEPGYRLRQIAPGIYSGFGTGTVNAGSNAAVIVNADDVLVVDAHMTPDAARVLLRELRTITDKPVRFVVNTHFHYDHTNGNQVFAPMADIIGHEYTRKRLAGDILERGMFASLLAQQRDQHTPFAQQLREVKPTPPTVTLDDRMTLYRGGREIRLIYTGRGHTAGDVVVYLPKERILCSGDLLVNGVANLVDGFVNEWPDALEKLRPLDFDDVIPGHGEPFRDVDAALERAYRRTETWEKDPLRMARHALKVVLAFGLLALERMPLASLPAFVDATPLFRDFNARFFRKPAAELAEELVAELERAGAVRRENGELLPI